MNQSNRFLWDLLEFDFQFHVLANRVQHQETFIVPHVMESTEIQVFASAA